MSASCNDAGSPVPPDDADRPLLISFAYGDDYYHRAADTLRADCARHGVDCHIVRVDLPAGTQWIEACRYKVRFMAECAAQFDRPLWWIDVDCRLLAPLPSLGRAIDVGFFLRGFRDLRNFDPVGLPRHLQPSILYFGRSAAARGLTARMLALEQRHEGRATDDWFLHEAWMAMPKAPAAAVFPPSWIRTEELGSADAIFDFGRSGQAGQYKGQADQHAIELFSPQRRKALFMREVSEAERDGRHEEATFFLRKARQSDPADVALAYRVAKGLQHDGRQADAERILREIPAAPDGSDHLTRFRLDIAMERRDISRASRLADELSAGASEGDRRYADSRRLRIGLEQRARKAWLRDRRRPQLWWMEGPYPGNFGDILNPYIVEKLTGMPPLYGPKGAGALAIGSTIRFALDGTAVWGTGTPRMSDRLNPRARYLAVRGPLTARLVTESGGVAPEVYGDPAVLLPRLYRPQPASRRYRLGIVLHHAHEGLLRIDNDDVKVIGVLRAGYAGIEAFIDELCACENILTSSLHGLIVSHAYGIPAQWFSVSDTAVGVPGDGTKYHDYLMSVGLDAVDPLRIAPETAVDPRMTTAVSLPRRPIDLDRLLSVAPWPLERSLRPPR
jgi:hypothetical protein